MTTVARISIILALAHFAAPSAIAGEAIDCSNPTSTVEMNECADRELAAADAKLNAAYDKALKSLKDLASDPPFDAKAWEEALRKSQRAWIAFRDAECKDHVPMFWSGGTGTTSAVLGCLSRKTKERTEELEESYASQ
jgi:uncharacterized protein YecT (DUF1311 family)